MPFPAGSVVLCEQGNDSTSGTHQAFRPQNRYALDLSNSVMDAVEVVAAAPGVVSFVYSDARPDDMRGGGGYGNQVRINHGAGFETLYAHLESVSAIQGRPIAAGEPVGMMGRTGDAGGRHLHFSLHRTSKGDAGVGAPWSLPIGGLRTSDVSRDRPFRPRWLAGLQFEADRAVPARGHLYASENVVGSAPTDDRPAGLAERILRARDELQPALDRRAALADLSLQYAELGAGVCAGTLAPILDADPENPVARYLHAVAVLMPQGQLSEARARLERALVSVQVPRRYEGWLIPYAQAQLGIIAAREGRAGEAEELFAKALANIPGLEPVVAPFRDRPGLEAR